MSSGKYSASKEIIGSSSEIKNIRQQIDRYKVLRISIVIEGEIGVGKTLIAEAINSCDKLCDSPLIKIMCSNRNDDKYIHSMLEKDHTKYKKQENGGYHSPSFLFNEVGELPKAIQSQLAYYLKTVQTTAPIKGESFSSLSRCIFITSTPFIDLFDQSKIVPELFYILSNFVISVPPLRERKTDVPELAEYLARYHSKLQNKPFIGLATSALKKLAKYTWPGNILQLENILEFSVSIDQDGLIGMEDLPETFISLCKRDTPALNENKKSLQELVEEYEKDIIIEALKSAHGNMSAAARIIKTTERVMGYKIKKYGIKPRSFKYQ